MPVVAFATCRRRPELAADDALVRPHLAAGVEVVAVPWDDPERDWRRFAAVVIRSTWDYHLRRSEFEAWLARLDGAGVPLWNPPAVVRWNLDKSYLRELSAAGVATVPTAWLERGEQAGLEPLLAERGWDRVVVKPTVGASSWGLLVADRASAGGLQSAVERLLERGGVMVQPLLEEVGRGGEWSLVFLGGELSHAVVKRPRDGEVRVQKDFGGTVEPATPGTTLRRWAESCVGRCPGGLLYARVDAVDTAAGPRLMELELIEPELFLGLAAGAARRFAGALEQALT